MTATQLFQTGGVEERLADQVTDPAGDGRTLAGYAATWNTPTLVRELGVQFREQVAPGAFAESLTRRTPKIQYNHGRDPKVGTLPIGAMTVTREDTHGLYVEARLFTSDSAEAVREAVAAGAISGMSFAFRVRRESWVDSKGRALDVDRAIDMAYRGEDVLRTLQAVDLFEAGPVLTPAYESTSVGVRSALLGSLTPGERATYLRGLLLRLGLAL
ncbi:HK97 family phage prohead protease [Streptomyces sp. DG2A-72]|uniref:HK97 family phage prohead protease n=1 Tax=Streptomyces sp. DG2A-72 TaxID=3051386 RepID=UPI00265B8F5D|nr:HK97 family phage prohead protease [Streptomyces sp. DG2A-72]MDO0938659.1 HK97 family phage prohead protease [Streptomyces sp. DG2A-72]